LSQTRFEIEFTPEAIEDMRLLKKRERNKIIDEIESQLGYQPFQETRNRKKLRPNQLAEWELRVGGFRVFYDIDTEVKRVTIEAVGYKVGSRLFIGREEFRL